MINNEPAIPGDNLLNEIKLFNEVAAIIESRKFRAQAQANQESVRIGSVLLNGERAKYGKQIVVTLAQQSYAPKQAATKLN